MINFLKFTDGKLITWLKNFIEKIVLFAASFGLSNEEVTGYQATAQQMIDDVAKVAQAQAAYKMAVATKKANRKAGLKVLALLFGRLQNMAAWTEAIAKSLMATSTQVVFDPQTFKPIATLKIIAGYIVVSFIKGRVTGMNIYGRRANETEWVLLAHVTRSGWIDKRPLLAIGVAEIRYIKLVGTINDQEIGQPSDVAEIVYAGK